MNTIPSTTKRLRVPYTVVGGSRSLSGGDLPRSLSILLLNRGGRPFKSSVLSGLFELGASEIVSVEGPAAQYDIEALSRRHPEIRFLILSKQVTQGERVNAGIEEAKGEFVLVLWNDMQVDAGFNPRVFESLVKEPSLCVAPALQNQRREPMPVVEVPALYRRRLKIVPTVPTSERVPTIFPFDYSGLYRKEAFVLTGGFDHLLVNPYWQKLDFGFRAFMWGEQILCSKSFKMRYLSEPPTEDTSHDESYRIFFLKNLAVRFSRDIGRLPVGKLPSYLMRSGGDFITAYREFRDAMRWVGLNQYRFKQDAKGVTELWEMPEP